MQTAVTKSIIRDSFIKLLTGNLDIDKITVSRIIEHAKISRQTFYYHFQDIYELQEWIIKMDFEKITNRVIECKTTYKEALWYIFEYIHQQKLLIGKALKSSRREFIELLIFENIRKYIAGFQEVPHFENIPSEEDLNFSIEFYSCAITGICIKLMSDKMLQTSTQDLIERIDKLVARQMTNGK